MLGVSKIVSRTNELELMKPIHNFPDIKSTRNLKGCPSLAPKQVVLNFLKSKKASNLK